MNDTSNPNKSTAPADGKPLVTPVNPQQQSQVAPKPDAEKSKEQQK